MTSCQATAGVKRPQHFKREMRASARRPRRGMRMRAAMTAAVRRDSSGSRGRWEHQHSCAREPSESAIAANESDARRRSCVK